VHISLKIFTIFDSTQNQTHIIKFLQLETKHERVQFLTSGVTDEAKKQKFKIGFMQHTKLFCRESKQEAATIKKGVGRKLPHTQHESHTRTFVVRFELLDVKI
jgi:hypothetical protein